MLTGVCISIASVALSPKFFKALPRFFLIMSGGTYVPAHGFFPGSTPCFSAVGEKINRIVWPIDAQVIVLIVIVVISLLIIAIIIMANVISGQLSKNRKLEALVNDSMELNREYETLLNNDVTINSEKAKLKKELYETDNKDKSPHRLWFR